MSSIAEKIDSIADKLQCLNCIIGYAAEKEMDADNVLLGQTLKIAEELGCDAQDEFEALMKEVRS